VPDIRHRYDAHDRRILRQYLVHSVEIYPPISNDIDGEDVIANTVVPAVRCHIDTRRRRVVTTRGEDITLAATLTVDRDTAIDLNSVLKNGTAPDGSIFFGEARVADFDPIDHVDRGRLTKTVFCVVH
jgi:hypothetical protein